MYALLLRILVTLALGATLWVTLAWLADPRLPFGSGEDLALFPFVAAAANFALRGTQPATIAYVAYAFVIAALLPAALLAAWLAWRAAPRMPARWLALSFALGALAGSYFWFLRDVEPWRWVRMPHSFWLDAAAMATLGYALVALVACFRIYPEPLSVDLVMRHLDRHTRGQDELVANMRAGRGFWRLWQWLPQERWGGYGRGIQPEVRGARRFLRSRELVWVLLFAAVVAYGLALDRVVMPEASLPWRFAFWIPMALVVVLLLDPLSSSRLYESRWSRALHRRADRIIAAMQSAEQRFYESPGGAAVVVLAALGITVLWHSGEPSRHGFAVVLLVIASIAGTGHALSLLLLNYRSAADAAHRRAIAWIFLGTAGALLAWGALFALAVLYAWLRAPEGAGLSPQARPLLLGIFVCGPPAVAACAIFATAASVLSRGTFDPGLALRRGAGYALLGMVLTALFVAIEGLVSSFVVVRFGLPSESGALIAGTSVALAFGPVRSAVEQQVRRLVDRWLPAGSLAAAERRECVVAFCDLVGYTSLAATDEPEALAHAETLHGVARRSLAPHGGRIVKTLGDAVMLVFDDAPRALAGLAALHAQYRDAARARQLEPLAIHASANRGEVALAADGDVFGATVNLAARLLGLAGADELVVPLDLKDAAGSLGLRSTTGGPVRLRNVPEPVELLRIALIPEASA